jgi:hypothetical protein
MDRTYSCPACKAVLNPEHAVIFSASTTGRAMLLGLHPEPGNYHLYAPEGEELAPGSLWRMRCPICGTDLQVGPAGELCLVHLTEGGQQKRVFFSPVVGRRLTFVVDAEGRVQRFGDDEDLPADLPFEYKV